MQSARGTSTAHEHAGAVADRWDRRLIQLFNHLAHHSHVEIYGDPDVGRVGARLNDPPAGRQFHAYDKTLHRAVGQHVVTKEDLFSSLDHDAERWSVDRPHRHHHCLTRTDNVEAVDRGRKQALTATLTLDIAGNRGKKRRRHASLRFVARPMQHAIHIRQGILTCRNRQVS